MAPLLLLLFFSHFVWFRNIPRHLALPGGAGCIWPCNNLGKGQRVYIWYVFLKSYNALVIVGAGWWWPQASVFSQSCALPAWPSLNQETPAEIRCSQGAFMEYLITITKPSPHINCLSIQHVVSCNNFLGMPDWFSILEMDKRLDWYIMMYQWYLLFLGSAACPCPYTFSMVFNNTQLYIWIYGHDSLQLITRFVSEANSQLRLLWLK